MLYFSQIILIFLLFSVSHSYVIRNTTATIVCPNERLRALVLDSTNKVLNEDDHSINVESALVEIKESLHAFAPNVHWFTSIARFTRFNGENSKDVADLDSFCAIYYSTYHITVLRVA
ncbi:unnamed protein product, partial [Mesorhabditis belari]|uniref:Secreted protein n=1 Tax=Mesorhabditis belari TaxID=2138241 RepID=A0AAF3FBQ1_9BILA